MAVKNRTGMPKRRIAQQVFARFAGLPELEQLRVLGIYSGEKPKR